jgi:hypothetical protein
VDVALEPAPTDARAMYAAARATAHAGVPGLDFGAARAALDRPGATVGEALRRDHARALVGALSAAGFGTAISDSRVDPPERRAAKAWLAVGTGVGVVAVVALAAVILTSLRSPVEATRNPTPASPIATASPSLPDPRDAKPDIALVEPARGKGGEQTEEHLLARLEQPVLVGGRAANGQLLVVVMRRWTTPGASPRITLRVGELSRALCEPTGVLTEWAPLAKKLGELGEQERARGLERWLARPRVVADAMAGTALVDVSGCPETFPQGTAVELEGHPEETLPYPISAFARAKLPGPPGSPLLVSGPVSVAPRGSRAPEPATAGASESPGTAVGRSEAEWRTAFPELRERIAALEETRRVYLQQLDRQTDLAALTRAQTELPAVNRELASLRQKLDELERQASLASVPQEWRVAKAGDAERTAPRISLPEGLADGSLLLRLKIGETRQYLQGSAAICDNAKVATISADGKAIITAVGPGETICSVAQTGNRGWRDIYKVVVER